MLFYAKQNVLRQCTALVVLIALALTISSIGLYPIVVVVTWVDIPQAIGFSALVGLLDVATAAIHALFLGKRYLARVFATLSGILGNLGLGGALGAGIVAGIGEEMLFRGALQPIIGVFPTIVVFALAHMGTKPLLRIAFWTALEGLWFGLLFQWTGKLIYPMIAHGIHDTWAILVIRYVRNHSDLPIAQFVREKDEETVRED